MTLQLADKWVWDFWFARDGEDYHIFFLQAPRSLKNPESRHWHTSIGHAISTNLVNWKVLPDALAPSEETNAFDNLTTWTGSIIQHHNSWYMFYTGTNREEQGAIQRIGLALSEDLILWRRYPGNPIMGIVPQWYEVLDELVWYEQAWRDPWVFEHEGKYHALITARVNKGEPDGRGVIGYASSEDLLHWEVKPPMTNPGEFSYLETPQLVNIGSNWYLFFCMEGEKYSSQRKKRMGNRGLSGTHYMIADHPLGPFRSFKNDALLANEEASFYSGKIIQNSAGDWVMLACVQFDQDNDYIGCISDPMPIHFGEDGQLFIKYSR